jgi:hypothetical protein
MTPLIITSDFIVGLHLPMQVLRDALYADRDRLPYSLACMQSDVPHTRRD